MNSKHRWIVVGRVQKEENGPWEEAILIGSKPGVSTIDIAILLKDNTPIKPPVWNYEMYPSRGCFVLELEDE